MLVDFEIEDDEYGAMDKRVFLETANNTNYRGLFNDNYRNMPVFFHAFYWHHVQVDLKKAKKLYKQAIKRSECPKGAYQMLCSIYICECRAELKSGEAASDESSAEAQLNSRLHKEYHKALRKLIAKIKALDDKYGQFLSYDPSYSKIRPKLATYVKAL